MKTKTALIVYVLFLIFIFLYCWFFWDLIDAVTPFLIIIPDIGFFIAIIVFLIYSIVYAVKNTKVQKLIAYIPLLIIVVTISLYLFFPFTKIKLDLDFKVNYQERNKVIDLIKTGELKPEETYNNLIILPEKYKGLSKGGGEVMVENIGDHKVYLFFTYRGILDSYSGFVYDLDEKAQEELSKEFSEVEKLCDSWYYCASV